jgi:O-antigen ligase
LAVTREAVYGIPASVAVNTRFRVWRRVLLVSLCAFLVFFTDATFRTRKFTAAATSIDAQVALQLLFWGLAGLVGFLTGGLSPRNFKGPTAVCALFILLMLVSTAYSPGVRFTAVSSIGYMSLFVFAIAMRRQLSDREILTGVGLGLSVIVLTAPLLFFAHAEPAKALQESASGQQRIHGLAEHAAGLGALSAMLIIISISILQIGGLGPWTRRMWRCIAFGSFVVLGLAFAKTAIIALTASGLLMWWRRKAFLRALTPLWVASVGAVVGLIAVVGIHGLLPQSIIHLLARGRGSSNDVGTFTGRTRLWEVAIRKIEHSPLFGYGWNTGRFEIFDKASRFPQIHTHNMYLQCLLYLGALGFVLFAAMIVYVLAAFARRPLLWRDWIAISRMILGLAEPSSLTNMPTTFTLLWFIVIAALRPREAEAEAQPVLAPAPAPIAVGWPRGR